MIFVYYRILQSVTRYTNQWTAPLVYFIFCSASLFLYIQPIQTAMPRKSIVPIADKSMTIQITCVARNESHTRKFSLKKFPHGNPLNHLPLRPEKVMIKQRHKSAVQQIHPNKN